jgi:hypothetical protein
VKKGYSSSKTPPPVAHFHGQIWDLLREGEPLSQCVIDPGRLNVPALEGEWIKRPFRGDWPDEAVKATRWGGGRAGRRVDGLVGGWVGGWAGGRGGGLC